MESKQKPDGWCETHPDGRKRCFRWNVPKDCHTRNALAYRSSPWELPLSMKRDGWRIRPCKIVFLDEGIAEEGKGDERGNHLSNLQA